MRSTHPDLAVDPVTGQDTPPSRPGTLATLDDSPTLTVPRSTPAESQRLRPFTDFSRERHPTSTRTPDHSLYSSSNSRAAGTELKCWTMSLGANPRLLSRLHLVSLQPAKVQLHLSLVCGLEGADLQFDGKEPP
jgi:hypothetical protein